MNYKLIILTLFFLKFEGPILLAQKSTDSTMEIEQIVKKTDLLKFIAENGRPLSAPEINDFIGQNLGSFGKVDKIFLAEKVSYLDIKPTAVYSFSHENKFCLYLFLSENEALLDRMAAFYGFPNNIMEEDFKVRDFEFLHWDRGEYDVWVNTDHIARANGNPNGIYIRITNMRASELLVTLKE